MMLFRFNYTNDVETHLTDEDHSLRDAFPTLICPSCAHPLDQFQQLQGGFEDYWGRVPAGVKFNPSDEQILDHLEAKVKGDKRKLHPLIDEFITTLEGDNGICYTHPQNLPGMKKDGKIRHFFHRPSKAYTAAGTRKRRKVETNEEGKDTRWHKTGKTRPVMSGGGIVMGFKKILVLYSKSNEGIKPQKTNWVMHQYHLGVREEEEEEKEGQLVASKVFFQKHPRHCRPSSHNQKNPIIGITEWGANSPETTSSSAAVFVDYCNPTPQILHHLAGPGAVHRDNTEFGSVLGDNNQSSLFGMGTASTH